MHLRKATMCSFIIFFIACLFGCGENYPSEAKTKISSLTEVKIENNPNRYGSLDAFYYKKDVIEKSTVLTKEKYEFYESFKKGNMNSNFPLYFKGSERDELIAEIKRLEEKRKGIKEEWLTKLSLIKKEQSEKTALIKVDLDKAKAKQIEYNNYIEKDLLAVTDLRKQILDSADRMEVLRKAVNDAFNEDIVSLELSIHKLRDSAFEFSWRTEKNKECSPRKNTVIVDMRKEKNACYYLSVPYAQLLGHKGSALMVESFPELLSLHTKIGSRWGALPESLRGQLNIAQKKLDKTYVKASNKFGERRGDIKSKVKSLEFKLKNKIKADDNDDYSIRNKKEHFIYQEMRSYNQDVINKSHKYFNAYSTTIFDSYYDKGKWSLTDSFSLKDGADVVVFVALDNKSDKYLYEVKSLMGDFEGKEIFDLNFTGPNSARGKDELSMKATMKISMIQAI